jgi:hypothetical protein
VFSHLAPDSLHTRDPVDESWPGGPDPSHVCDPNKEVFLDFYGLEGLRAALESYGLTDRLRELHLGEPRLSFDKFEGTYDVLRVHGSLSPHPLGELIAKVGPLPPEIHEPPGLENRRFLHVKWLRMQNPLAAPHPDKPLLPGQQFPGLGLGRELMALLQMMAVRLDLDGVVELPERLHNAVLYFVRFRFLDPVFQGTLTAILRDCLERNLSDLAWGVECGALLDRVTRKPFRWLPREQVLPRTGPALDWLESEEYLRRAKQAMDESSFLLSCGDIAGEMAAAQGLEAGTLDNPFPVKIK